MFHNVSPRTDKGNMTNFNRRTNRRQGRGAGQSLALCAAVAAATITAVPLGRAHETDQYSVPVGRPFADLRYWYSEEMYDKLAAALDATNAKIARTLRNGRPTPETEKARSPDNLAWTLLLQFPPVIHQIETVEAQLRSSKLRARYPGLVTAYLPARWIYHHPFLLLDPTKLPRLRRSSTMLVNGTYFGTDKIAHFVHMGYLYFRTYHRSLERGASVEEALREGIRQGAGDSIFSENHLLGLLPTGVISNGDKAANYLGMKMYVNLTEPVMLRGKMHPPLWVSYGEFFRFNSHVRRDTDFFSVFVDDHFNEALNPNTYGIGQERWIMDEIRKRCPDVLAWYRAPDGRAYTRDDFRRIAEELTTYYGEDYGWAGNLDEMVGVLTACFPADGSVAAPPSTPTRHPDSFGRTALWRAARAGRLAEVQSLARGGHLDTADLDRETPLHAAVRSGSAEVVRALLHSGASPNAANRHGATPLHLAVQNNSLDIVDDLLGRGASAEARDQFGCTPLQDAARKGSPAVLRRLLAAGAKVQTADLFGSTPLHRAARAGRTDIVELLLGAGAHAAAPNAVGHTPLDYARQSRDPAVLTALMQSRRRSNSISER
jgi:ankyrin repeat protein